MAAQSRLKDLLDNGIPDYNSLERQARNDKYKEIVSLDVRNEPCLELVNDFASKHINKGATEKEREEYRTSVIKRFCLDYILKKRPFCRTAALKKDYYNDYEIQGSYQCFEIDPEKFWYLLLFCRFYVNALTGFIPIKKQSVREQLQSFVQEVSKMDFSSDNWINSYYPNHAGKISFYLDKDRKSLINITDPRTIHLLYMLIKKYLSDKHDKATSYSLDINNELNENIRSFINMSNKVSLPPTFKELTDSISNKTLTEQQSKLFDIAEWQTYVSSEKTYQVKTISLMCYYLMAYIGNAKVTNKQMCDFFPEYNDKNNKDLYHHRSDRISVSKWFLLSRLIYKLKFLPIRTNDQKNNDRFYNDAHYLEDYLRNNEITKPEDEENYLNRINPDRVLYF